MLKVSRAQLKAFDGLEQRFEDRVRQFVLEQLEDRRLAPPAEALAERVRVGIALARYRRLTWESSIAAYVGLMFTVHPWFERQRDVAAVFREGSVEPDMRLHLLRTRVSEQSWAEAARQAPPADDAWDRLCTRYREAAP